MGNTGMTINISFGARLSVLVLLVASLFTGPDFASFASSKSEELAITPSFDGTLSIAPRDAIEFRFSRQLDASEGRIAILVARTDVSSLLIGRDNTLVYTPSVVPLPEGDNQVLVFLVTADNAWKQIGQYNLRVAPARPSQSSPPPGNPSGAAQNGAQAQASSTPGQPGARKFGFDRANITPSVTIGMKSQPAERNFPDLNRPPRPTFADLTLQGSVQSDMARGIFNAQTQFNIVGTSFENETLRFGQEGNAAPLVDLASFLMQFQIGKTKILFGHQAFGSNRQLLGNFLSRGISVTTPLSNYVDVSFGAMNGTNIVGWDNFFGLSKTDHQFYTGTAGVEFIPERRGELRFELSVLDGSLLPISSFNQANITDAERSRGIGLRFLGSDPKQRWRFDGGFTRSRFTNPTDPLLSQGFNLVPVRAATRNAGYFDGAFTVVQNAALSETKRANLILTYKHEQVDPLFKSVGAAAVLPDRLQNEIGAIANVGDLTATFTDLWFHDNLRNVPSVLKSLSRRTALILGTPLSSLFGHPKTPSPWLPRVSYTLDETHQFAASIPVNGGFEVNPSTVPNQVSTNQSLSADWQLKQVRWGYRFNRSFQDNRQVGREQADLRNITNIWSVGLQASAKLVVNLDVGWDSALNKEQKRTDHTFRVGPNVNWIMTKSMAFTGFVSATSLANVAGTALNRTTEVDLQWSYRFGLVKERYKKVQAQFFVRYANRYAFASDSVFGLRNLTKLQTLNTGINFTFF